jgi:hypothetical protein
MAYAAEEAERLANRHIGTEHLLLGLLRESGSFAAQLLNEEGVVVERARENIADWQRKHGVAQETEGAETVDIHGNSWNLGYVRAQVTALRKFAWRKREWKALDVLMESGTSDVFFDLSVEDDPQFKLVTAGWPRDWCLICNWDLNTDGGEEHSHGYTNGRQWLCVECYEKFLSSGVE